MPRAVKFDGYGGIDVLRVVEVDRPVPGPEQVIIRMKAAGINPGEAAIREGAFAKQWPATFPSGQGSDLAGVVEAVGSAVRNVAVGDEVVGFTNNRSSHAELVVVEADHLVGRPTHVSWEQAGALFVAGTTAYAAVHAVSLKAGDTVVISGAAGGVGSIAVQLAKILGAKVIGLASAANHTWLADHGVIPVAYGEGVADRIRAETGLITDVGEWVLVQACKAAMAWPATMRVAVNVSAVQLQTSKLLPSVVKALNVSTLPARRLEIEITETAVIDDSNQVLSNLKALRELGVRIALDDFGTGYSSLTCMQRLSPDSIKVDGSFVRELVGSAGSRSIVKSVIHLSRDLSINVVAEGIETSEQLEFLCLNRCDEGQGHFLGVPKLVNEIGPYLQSTDVAKISAA